MKTGTLVTTERPSRPQMYGLVVTPCVYLATSGTVFQLPGASSRHLSLPVDSIREVSIVDSIVLMETLVFPLPVALERTNNKWTAAWRRDPGVYQGMLAVSPAGFRCEATAEESFDAVRKWWTEILPPTRAALGYFQIHPVFYVVSEATSDTTWFNARTQALHEWEAAGRPTRPPAGVGAPSV